MAPCYRSPLFIPLERSGSIDREHESEMGKQNNCIGLKLRSKSVSQSVSQSASQPASQPARQSVSQSVSQSGSQPASQPARQSVSQSVTNMRLIHLQQNVC